MKTSKSSANHSNFSSSEYESMTLEQIREQMYIKLLKLKRKYYK